jgi:hypothetical protein
MAGRFTMHTFGRSEALERRAWIHHSTCELYEFHTASCFVFNGNATPWREVGQGKVGQRLPATGERRAISIKGEPEIPNRKLLERATGESTKCLLIGCSFTANVMHQVMSASII